MLSMHLLRSRRGKLIITGFRLVCLAWLITFVLRPISAQDEPTISVSPESGTVAEALLMIEFAGLEADTLYTVEFLFDGEVVFSSEETSDESGQISYPAASTEDDLPGIYTVQAVLDGEVVASAEFELTAAEASLPGSITVSPEAGPIGAVHTLEISELDAQTEYTVEITARESLQVGYRKRHKSDDDGGIEIELFAEEGDAPGLQTIAVYDEAGELVAAGEFTIEAPRERNAAVEIHPPFAQAGSAFAISISGLAPFDSVRVEIVGAEDAIIETLTARASSDGVAEMTFNAPDDLALGSYHVGIRVAGVDGEMARASLEIVAEDTEATAGESAPGEQADAPTPPDDGENGEATASIEPQASMIGTTHAITVRDLAADESVTIEVTYEGRTVYTTDKVADENGAIQLELFTTAGDKPGDYLITVLRESGNQPSVVLTATLEPIADLASPPDAGTARTITRSLLDGSATVRIATEADQILRITVDADGFDPAATLYDRYGYAIASNDDSRQGWAANIGPLRIPESGDYELEVYPAVGVAAHRIVDHEFAVSVETVSVAPINYDSGIAFALGPDAPALYYELPVKTGDSLTITIDSAGQLDTVMQVVGPDGIEFAYDDDSGYGFDAELSKLIFDRSATYILAVTSFDGAGHGKGTLAVARNPVHALEDGSIQIDLNDKAIRDLAVFDAEADETLILRLKRIAGEVEDFFVTATVEGMEVMSYSTMGLPDELPLAFVMPMSGRVVVALEKFGHKDGISLSLSLERP